MPINLKGPIDCLTTPVLIGDTVKIPNGSNDAIPTPTKVNGNPIAAALEIQSTGGGFVLPRMTAAQKVGLTPVIAGMQVYDTDLGGVSICDGVNWGEGFSQTIEIANITGTQIIGMNQNSIQIIPGIAGKAIIVDRFALIFTPGATAFTTGGSIYLQYNTAPGGYNVNRAASRSISVNNITNNTQNFALVSGAGVGSGGSIQLNDVTGAGLYLTCATAFDNNGGNGTLRVKVWYTVIDPVLMYD